ncbi:WD40-repeat-containing domain protein [Chaetomium strumarium]|uniref:WD40-repeat-containing domain protein n=1 Tax=Chaetomium strumarium TaxID=1170767 RepID=A0AAJ0GKY6_9PEZI|nr:WD40-repeat-containing domain protein [Chaetomium strumarium]
MEHRAVSGNTFGDNTRIHLGDVIYPPDASLERSLERLSLPEASFDAANKQHVASCLPNTRRDVLAQIRRWADGDGGGQRMYWLKGMAGTGKSTIALTIAREYSDKKRLGASFFFSRGGGDLGSTRRFAATVAVQLAETSPELSRHIAGAVASSHRIRGLGLYDQWEKLVLRPLAQLGREAAFPHPLVIVVDALDECDNNDVSFLIRCLATAAAVEHVDFRVFVTSRPDQPISLAFDSIAADTHQDLILHDIEQSIIDQDLTVYYKYQLGRMAPTSGLDAVVFSDAVVEKLVKKSCGLFIYAATICRFVREGGPLAGDRLAQLISDERLPARAGTELDRMYTTVLEYSLSGSFDTQETARVQELFGRVVGSIAVLFKELSPDSLAMMVAEPRGKIKSMLGKLHSVVDVPEQEGRLIRLHPSFREFLLDPQRCSNAMFRIDAKKAHGKLFDCCLAIMSGHLRRNMCDLQRPGTRVGDIPRSDVDKSIPFAVQYACQYWVYHLEQSDVDPREHPGIVDFFHSRFLSWLEILALTGRLADGIAMIKLLEGMLPVNVTSGYQTCFRRMRTKIARKSVNDPLPLNAFVHDAKRFLLSHSQTIEEAPLQAYCSALVFSPQASIIRRLYIHQLPKWILRAPALSEDWGAHLKTLSHPSLVEAVAVSPDGQLIVSGSRDNTVCVWDATIGVTRRVLEGHKHEVRAVAVSPDSRLTISGSWDKTVRVWDATTGAMRRVLNGHSDAVSAVAVSTDGQFIVSGSHDATVRVWDIATGATKSVLSGHTDAVLAIAISDNSQLIVSGSLDNTVRVWDITTGAIPHVLKGHSYLVTTVAVSRNRQLIVSGSYDNTVRVWDAATGATQRVLKGHTDAVSAVAILPDGQFIVSGSHDNTVRVWDIAKGVTRRVLEGHSNWVTAIAVSLDSQFIVSGSYDATVRVWDATIGVERCVPKGPANSVSAITVLPDIIVSGSYDNTVRVWDVAMGATRCVLKGHAGTVSAVAVSPDGQLIISGSFDMTVRVWDITKGAIRRVFKGHTCLVSDVAVLPDSRLIVSGSHDNTVRVWDIAAGAIQRVLKGHTDAVSAVAVSSDGQFIVSGSFDNTVRVWDTATGATRRVLKGHRNWVMAVAISLDRRLIISGDNTSMVRVWDATTGVTRRVVEGHSWVSAVAVSPDGQLIASSSSDKTVRIWDMETGAEQLVLPVAIALRHLSFSPCGKHLVTDCGILPLPSSGCRCSRHVFATRCWITDGGEDLLYLHPDYQESFGFLSGSIVVYLSQALQLSLSREAVTESAMR